MKFKIFLEVEGADLWHVVMKLVENNEGITLLNPDSMISVNNLQPSIKQRRTKKSVGRATTMRTAFLAYAQEKLQDKTFTRQDVAAWMEKDGHYNPNSASPLTSQLVKSGDIINIAPMTFRLK